MQTQASVVFRDMQRSEALEKNIQTRIDKLEKTYDRITRCNVVVEEAHQHKHKGKLFHIRIKLDVPDQELVVSREKHDRQAHQDPYVAVRDSFNAMRRQLDDYARKTRTSSRTRFQQHELLNLTATTDEASSSV